MAKKLAYKIIHKAFGHIEILSDSLTVGNSDKKMFITLSKAGFQLSHVWASPSDMSVVTQTPERKWEWVKFVGSREIYVRMPPNLRDSFRAKKITSLLALT